MALQIGPKHVAGIIILHNFIKIQSCVWLYYIFFILCFSHTFNTKGLSQFKKNWKKLSAFPSIPDCLCPCFFSVSAKNPTWTIQPTQMPPFLTGWHTAAVSTLNTSLRHSSLWLPFQTARLRLSSSKTFLCIHQVTRSHNPEYNNNNVHRQQRPSFVTEITSNA
jgi:hypothetical protein